MLEVRLLGRFEIRYGEKTVDLSSRPAQALFAFLVLNAGTAYRREKLAGQLWPESTDESARDYLRHALWRIRKALQPISASNCIQANDLTVTFNTSSNKYWLDAAALQKADEAGPIDRLADALTGYAGELLPGFYDEWVVLEREHLQAVYERKVGRLLELLQAAGQWQEVLEWAEKWIALGQKPEAAYRAIMRAYAANGDMFKVVVTYQRCAAALHEWEVDPSEQTRALYQQLNSRNQPLQAVPPKVQTRPSAATFRDIPKPLTSFIGREHETAEVLRLIAANRIVTLTGPGGVGKTRLAIHLADRLNGRFEGGIFWVELAPLFDASLVPQTVANALEVREHPKQTVIEAIQQSLSTNASLLVLDNCEHLILACAKMVERLVSSCPHLQILTTSREALGIQGEQMFEVPNLSVPVLENFTLSELLIQYPGVHLFVERIQARQPDFQVTDHNAPAIYEICRRLDGIPLALELAAARTRLLTVQEIAARLHDRFNLLTQGSRTALPRQRTLRATIDWSYDLLSEQERTLLRRLSVFVGGFTLHAVEQVCTLQDLSRSQVIDILGRLVDKSLLHVDRIASTGDSRYGMLETLHEYLTERLQESREVASMRTEHLRYYSEWLESIGPNLSGVERDLWIRRTELETDNLRWALDCSLDLTARHSPSAAFTTDRYSSLQQQIHLSRRLGEVLHSQARYGESIAVFTVMYQTAEACGDLLGQCWALEGMADASDMMGDNRRSIEAATQAEAIARAMNAHVEIMRALIARGRAHFRLGEAPTALTIGQECLLISQQLGDQVQIARSLSLIGAAHHFLGEYDQAETHFLQALATFRGLGYGRLAAEVLNNLGTISDARGDFEQAHERYNDAWVSARDLGHRDGEIAYLANRGGAAVARGSFADAEADLRKVIDMAGGAGFFMMPNAYLYLAQASLGQGKVEESIQQAVHALELAEASGVAENIGVAWRVLALIGEKSGKPINIRSDNADRHGCSTVADCYRKSEEILNAAEMKVERARTLREWARYEIASGDMVEGKRMWNEARVAFQQVGAVREIQRMDERRP